AFGVVIGGGENLLALLVQQEVIVAEMRSRHVPMKIFRLYIQGEHIGEERRERSGDFLCGIRFQIGWSCERCHTSHLCLFDRHGAVSSISAEFRSAISNDGELVDALSAS